MFADLDQWEERTAADEIDLTPPPPPAPAATAAAYRTGGEGAAGGMEAKIQNAEAQTQRRGTLLDPAIATDAPALMERQKPWTHWYQKRKPFTRGGTSWKRNQSPA